MSLLLALTLSASAADVHVCACGAGADLDCVAGDDTADGSAGAPLATLTAAQTLWNSALGAGDRVLLCEGGVFSPPSSLWFNSACTAASPCEVTAYLPDWASGDEARPVIASTGTTPFDFSNPGGAIHQEGVVVSGLDLTCTDCTGSAASGVFISNDLDHVLLEDLQIRGFEIGIHQGGSNDCDPSDASCDGKNTDLTVRNVTVERSTVIGMLAGGDRLAILDSVFRENGSGSAFHHNLYVSSPSGSSSDVRIERNTLYRSAWLANGTCEGTSLVVHGVQSGLEIRDNLVYEDIGSATEACWGITVDAAYSEAERFEDVTIAGNRVLHVGNLGIGVSSCVGCTLENNVVTNAQAFPSTGIAVPSRPRSPEDAPLDNVVVRHNSIAMHSGTGLALRTETEGLTVVNNAIALDSGACFETSADPAFSVMDHTVCQASQWTLAGGDLAAWQALGLGPHSQATDPRFANVASNDLSIDASSPLMDAGDATLASTTDLTGLPRDAQPDIGAYEVPPTEVVDSGDTGNVDDTGAHADDTADPGPVDTDPTPTNDTASGTESGADSEEQAGKGGGCAVASSATGAAFWGLFAVALRRRSEPEDGSNPDR
jgi:hypothetical protein